MNRKNFPCWIVLCWLLTACAESDPGVAEIPDPQKIMETETNSETIPETSPESVKETIPEASPESITETISETSSESVTETIPETISETIPETESMFPMPETIFFNSPEQLEIYQKITLQDFILDTNVVLQDPEIIIDTSQTGLFEIPVKYYYGTEIREQIITYQVADTTPPVILNNGSGAFIRTGQECNIRNLIGYGDQEDPAPSLTYAGEIDTSVPGEYPFVIYITDRSGNQAECNLIVTVGDEKPDQTGSQQQMQFQDFVSQYSNPGRQTAFGIDVSKWQGYIDYNAVRQAGCEFVFLRIGASYGNPPVLDEYYFYNIDSAKQAGLQTGVYFYTTDTTEDQIRADADWIVEQLDGRELDFPIVFDWEDFRNFQKYEISLHDLSRLYEVFSEQLSQSGYETMLYGSKNYLVNAWGTPMDHPVWLAHYAQQTDYPGQYQFWQRTDTGIIPGIDVPVDFDIYYQGES